MQNKVKGRSEAIARGDTERRHLISFEEFAIG
jgi:hypothetical protein